ncbi:MAG: endonuclease III [Halobacteria archaeon]|nr:endonuclease III [Halobacteria archaeon]
MDRQERAQEVYERLEEEYPEAHTTLDYETPFQLLVATVLSAQCTDERVNKVTTELFDEYPTPEAMAEADEDRLKEIIRSTGYYNSKSDYLLESSRRIVEEYGGEVPRSMDELTTLKGVARKTANVVLSNAFDSHEGIAVDTHVQRVSQRLGITEEEKPERIEEDLMEIYDRDQWRLVSHLLIFHGRATCTARSPDCGDCVLEDICPSSEL